MKLLTMKCIKDPYLSKDSNPIGSRLGQVENFVKLERDIERQEYDESIGCDSGNKEYLSAYWDGYLSAKLDWQTCDENIYYYIEVNEPEPAVGEQYTDADGLVWERVK